MFGNSGMRLTHPTGLLLRRPNLSTVAREFASLDVLRQALQEAGISPE